MHTRMDVGLQDPEMGAEGHRSQGRRTSRTRNSVEHRRVPEVKRPDGGESDPSMARSMMLLAIRRYLRWAEHE
jgi:hypothetical protein